MASGKQHERINLIGFGVIAIGYVSYWLLYWIVPMLGPGQSFVPLAVLAEPHTVFGFAISYLVGAFLVTPDLDLAEQRVRAKHHLGVLGYLWVPYGKMFAHRGLSHTWFVGPFTRLVYIALLTGLALVALALAVLPFGYRVRVVTDLSYPWGELVLAVLAGYYLSQWLHLMADGVSPWYGHQLRRRAKGRAKVRKRRARASTTRAKTSSRSRRLR